MGRRDGSTASPPLLSLVCWGLTTPFQASAQSVFLTVASDLPGLSDTPEGRLMDYDPNNVDPVAVPVADVLKLVAAKAQLKLVLNNDFKARA